MNELSATVYDCLSWGPCTTWPESRIREVAGGKERWTARDVLGLRGTVSDADLLWLLLRPELLSERVLHELSCQFAEAVLPIYERQFPGDHRPRLAIEARRRWLGGEASVEDLAAANAAARSAANAANSAAYAAALSAAWAADAAAYAANSAAGSAAYAAQLDMIARVIEEMEQ